MNVKLSVIFRNARAAGACKEGLLEFFEARHHIRRGDYPPDAARWAHRYIICNIFRRTEDETTIATP